MAFNALALYNLNYLPNPNKKPSVTTEVAVQPTKKLKLQNTDIEKSLYYCSKCHKELSLSYKCSIQCWSCGNRIVFKKSSGKAQTYQAV